MKRVVRVFFAVLMLCLSVFVLAGCGGNGVAEMAGDYVINEANHTVTCKESDYGLTFTYAYTISGSSLTLQVDGGLPRTFEK